MSGLSGYVTLKSLNEDSLRHIGQKMNDVLKHRGPDSQGLWCGSTSNTSVVMGHRRLAVLDLTAAGQQPMHTSKGRFVVLFNGEIYNYVSLRDELRALGAEFISRSDTEVVVSAIEIWGLNQTLQKLRGMFALVVWDTQKQEIHFARDPFGEKPMFVGWHGDDLIFGSELKVFKAFDDFHLTINFEAFRNYMDYGYIHAPLTIYENIINIPAGCRLTLDFLQRPLIKDLKDQITPYWQLHEKVSEYRSFISGQSSFKSAIELLDQEIRIAVNRCMVSDVPIGMILSDTPQATILAAVMQGLTRQDVSSFTLGIKGIDGDRVEESANVAQHLGLNHHSHEISQEEVLDYLLNPANIYDEPYAEISSCRSYFLSKFIHKKSAVLISANGAKSAFGGTINKRRLFYNILKDGQRKSILSNLFLSSRKNGMKELAFISNLLSSQIRDIDSTKFVKSVYIPRGLKDKEERDFLDLAYYLPNSVFRKTDTVSMRFGLQKRAPYLNENILKLVWSLPYEYKIKKTGRENILSSWAKRYYPKALNPDAQYQFRFPIAKWLKDELRGYSENLLEDLDPELFNVQSVDAIWQQHLKGETSHQKILWRILMFQQWSKNNLL